MKKILLICSIIIASIFQISAQCLMYPVLLSQRVPQSSLIVEGKVINQQAFWNTAHDKIFTSNLVEVYKTFKNTSAAYIEIITEGGIVGNDKHVFEPTLELEVGDVGVFTLNQNNQISQFGKQVYDAYASAQGFIKYDVVSDIATEPFNKYLNASSSLYNTIAQYTGANYVQVKPINPFQIATPSINTVQNIAAITSFSPTTITAGTFSVLTINGSGFGTVSTPSLIAFKNADDGGATTISPVASEIVSWTATQIQVKVPTDAGTGVIKVGTFTSSATLTIPYSHLNLNQGGTVYNTKHINQSGGGYTWTYNTTFNSNTAAKAAFQRSLQSWRCATYINWPTSATTSTITASANDGTNIVTFNSGLGAGILGQCGSYWSGCGTNPNMTWFVTELDIQFSTTPGGGTWQYGPAAPSASQYDFESVTVHELGHGHQLGHVINSSDLMHYALSNGQSKRTLNTDDLNGGLAVMVRNAQAGGTCGNPLLTPLTSGNCALGAPTASFTANRTTVCPGQTVIFTNLSTGSPTATTWTFAGGTPSTSTVSSPTVTYNTPGSYSVQLVATNANGSNTYSVAAYINVVSVASLPLVQDFQGTFLPTNWYSDDSGNDNIKWAKATTAGAITTTNSAFFDNFSSNVTGTRDELKTFVNLSSFTSAKMTFYRAYSQTFSSPNIDSLEIRVSTNCGSSSTQAYYKGGSQISTGTGNGTTIFIPTSAQWAKDSIDLTPYVGQNSVMISLINRSNYGDGLYIDQINITGVGAATSPTAAITSASVGCTGVPITLTDASTGSPTSWTWTMAGGTPTTATTQNTSVTYTSAGVKTITLTVANGSGTTTATKSITITATPTVVASVTNTTICNGGSVVENLTGATTYTWLPSGSGATSTLTPTSTTIYTITGSTSGCTSAVRNVTVTVSPNPTVNVTASSSTICVGQTSTLTASGGTSYAWLPGGQTTTTITVTPTANTTYTVTGSNGTCSSTKTITINTTTSPTISTSITNTTICSGTSVVASLTGATTYTWLPSGSGSTSTLSPSSTTIYTVTGSNGSCTSAPKNFTITVNTSPTVAVTASSSSICAGQSTTLTASGATTYAWLPGGQTTTVVAVTPTANTTYTVTGSNGTCSSSKTIAINVSTTPTVATSITNTTICSGTSVVVSLTGAASYTWLPSGSGSTSTLSPTSTTIYTVTGSNGGCVSTSKTFTINVNTSPTVAATASSSNICAGQSATLTASGATTYAWLPGGQTTTVVAVTPTANTTYTVTGSNGTCSSTKTITVNVNTTPTVATSITNTTICSGASIVVNLTGASSYTWSPSGSGATSTLSPTSTTIYTVTGSNGTCIGASNTFTINTTPSPTVTSVSSPTLICTGQTATLTASGATNYTWTPSATLSSANGSIVVANPTTTTVYTVTGSNGTCTSNNSISLTVSACTGIENMTSSETISIYPNPNNGVFTISTSTSIESLNITIINALGQTVKSETIKNSNQTTIDMSMMSKGVYYLKAKTNEGTKLFKVILE